MSSTMNRDEGTPVDSEVVADAVGTELTVVPGEQDQVNTPARISEVERDMAAAGKITAEDREMLRPGKRGTATSVYPAAGTSTQRVNRVDILRL